MLLAALVARVVTGVAQHEVVAAEDVQKAAASARVAQRGDDGRRVLLPYDAIAIESNEMLGALLMNKYFA